MYTRIIVLTLLFFSLSLPALAETDNSCKEANSSKTEKKVLDPNQFFGQAKAGYVAAQRIPEICAKLFCYCGCDLTDCHGTLLDCFTSDHGVDCHICQEEALIALRLNKRKKPLAKIQKYIDKRYAKEYPFEMESKVLKDYKASRLWDKKKKKKQSSKKAKKTEAKTRGQKTFLLC